MVYLDNVWMLYSNETNKLLIHARMWMIQQNIIPVKEVFYKKLHCIWWFHLYGALEQINPFCGEKSQQWLHLEGRRHRVEWQGALANFQGFYEHILIGVTPVYPFVGFNGCALRSWTVVFVNFTPKEKC